jgi:uncharacterized membrane protein
MNKMYIINAMIAAAYVVLVYAFSFLSFNDVQFRVAEVLLIVYLFNSKTLPGLLTGTFIANMLFSPLTYVDAVVGTFATLLALTIMSLAKKQLIVSLIAPAITNGVFIGLMLYFLIDLPLLLTMGSVFIGELAVMLLLGLPVYFTLKRQTILQEYLQF